MKKSALIIGEFQKTEQGYTGKLNTLAHKGVAVSLVPNEDKEQPNHPDFIFMHADAEIGVAWDRNDSWAGQFVSIAPEEPSLGAGVYKLVKSQRGINAYDLLYRKSLPKKDGK